MVWLKLLAGRNKMSAVKRIATLVFMIAFTTCWMIFLFAMLLMSGTDVNGSRELVPARRSLQLSQSQVVSIKPQLHILSLSYMDQLSWASRRLMSLQCWSSMWNPLYDVRVVEPFVIDGAHLGVPIYNIERYRYGNTTLKFEDIFNVVAWNMGPFSKLVSWDHFLGSGPRSVVAVQIVYREDYRCPENDFTAEVCSSDLAQALSQILPKDFTVIRHMCINFRLNNTLTMSEFNRLILGPVPGHAPVTIIFDEWRGMGKKHNVDNQCFLRLENGSDCTPNGQEIVGNLTTRLTVPSSKIKDRAKAYISRYLDAKPGYVAVLVRWEKVVLHDFYDDRKSQHYSGSGCTDVIMDYVKRKRQRRMNTAFFATDIGKHGSSTFDQYNHTQDIIDNITVYTEDLIRTLHRNDSMTLADYERRFEEASGTTNPAFISQMQKAIAANARCLLLVGWGAFQESVLKMYRKIHPRVQTRCAKVILAC